mgnify:FL=1
MRYRKKPVEVEAIQVTRENVKEVANWCGGRVVSLSSSRDPQDEYVALDIPTLEGVMRAETFHQSTWRGGRYHGGDYVIRGVQGEFYPCTPDIFEETYEIVDE